MNGGTLAGEKMFPAAVAEDQEAIMNGTQGGYSLITTPPFSSPDPEHNNVGRMEVVDVVDDVSSHAAKQEAAAADENGPVDYNAKKFRLDDLKKLADERGVEVDGNSKKHYADALTAHDAENESAASLVEQVKAATTQDELDAVANLYAATEKEWTTVDHAIEAKQTELDENDEN